MAEQIVDLLHHVRKRGLGGQHPSIRAAVMIARVLASQGLSCDPTHPMVVSTCRDVLHLGQCGGKAGSTVSPEDLPAMLQTLWGSASGRVRGARPSPASSAGVQEALV
jgi:hypothetical protein